ncbi:MAG: PadR family transcriptional regulator [Candidatus Dormibacteria bacterium]
MSGYSETELLGLGRFSEPSLLVLASLADGPKHGYAIMQDISRFHGTRMEAGTLYAVLARLEPRGWIEPLRPVGRRRPYRLTDAGRAELHRHVVSLERVVATARRRLAPGTESSMG